MMNIFISWFSRDSAAGFREWGGEREDQGEGGVLGVASRWYQPSQTKKCREIAIIMIPHQSLLPPSPSPLSLSTPYAAAKTSVGPIQQSRDNTQTKTLGVSSDQRRSLARRHPNTCPSFHMRPICRCLCQKVCTGYSANRFKVPLLMCHNWHLFILRAPVLLIIVLRKSVFTAKSPFNFAHKQKTMGVLALESV